MILALGPTQQHLRHHAPWDHAHCDDIEETDKGHANGDGRVEWPISVEQKKCDEDHEHAFAVEVPEKLEVLDHSLPLKFRAHQQGNHWNEVESQHVVERVLGRLVRAEVDKAHHDVDREGQVGEPVQGLKNVDQACFVYVLRVGVASATPSLILHHFKI